MNHFPYSCFHCFLVNANIEVDRELGEPFPWPLFLGTARETRVETPLHSLPCALMIANCSASCYCSARPQRWGTIIQACLARQESTCRTGR